MVTYHSIPCASPSRVQIFLRSPSVLHWPDEVADIVFDALRIFGYGALRLKAADERRLSWHRTGVTPRDDLASLNSLFGRSL